MSSISLTSYSVRIRKKFSDIVLPLDDFSSGNGLLHIFDQTFTSLKQDLSKDMEALTCFGIKRYTVTNENIYGQIIAGDFGYESDLVNVDSNQTEYHRTTNVTDARDFYMLLHIPPKATRGILLVEKKGNIGIKTLLFNYFYNLFINDFHDVSLTVNLLTPNSLIDSVLKDGRFTEIEFIKIGVPSDYFDVIANSGGNFTQKGTIKRVISGPRGGFLGNMKDRIRDVLTDKRTVKNMYEIPDEYDNIKVKVELDEHERIMDIGNILGFRPNFDITEKIEYGDDGNPTYESINREAFQLLEILKNDLGKDYAK